MSRESFNEARAELFEALGHPVRVRILEALEAKPLGFAEVKKSVGIESSGHLQFHLRKLGGLISGSDNGTYALTDDGKEALRVFRTTAEGLVHPEERKGGRLRANKRIVAVAGILTFLVLLSAFAASGGVIYLSQSQFSTYARNSYVPGSWYTIQFNGTGGQWVDFNIILGGLPAGNQSQEVLPIQIQLAHVQGINLKSLSLQFQRVSVGPYWVFDSIDYAGVGGYPPPSAKLTGLPGATTLDLQDVGFLGTGSVNIFLNLILDNAYQFPAHPAQNNNGSVGLVIVMQFQDASHILFANDYNGYAYVSMTPQANGLLRIDRVSG